MSQHDYVIDNQSAPNFRADLNSALAAIATTNGGTSAPSTTYANQLWVDTTNNQLKIRNEDNDAWIVLADLNQTADTSAPPDASITFAKLAAAAVVTSSETIAANNNNTTIPTSAAVKAYADAAVAAAGPTPPTAGSTFLIRRIQEQEYSNASTTYLAVGNHDRFSFSGNLGFTALVAGTVRCYLEHAISGGGLAGEVRILKNGVAQASWQTTSTSFVARTLDLPVAVGDVVIYQQRMTNNTFGESRWRNLRVYSGNNSFAVA